MRIILILLIFGLGLVQICCTTTSRNLLDDINKNLLDLQGLATELQASSLETLLSNIDQLRHLDETVRLNATTQVNSKYEILLDHVRNITYCANYHGYPVECIADKQVILMNLPNQVTALIDECLRRSLNEGIDIVEMSVAVIETLHDSTTKIKKKIEECEMLPLNEICLEEVNMEIALMIGELSTLVKDTLIKTDEIVSTIERHMNFCSTLRVLMIVDRGNDIINEMLNCVNKPLTTTPRPTTDSTQTTEEYSTTYATTTERQPCTFYY